MKIKDAILERFNNVRERIAEAIHDGDWSTVAWNVALILAVVMVAVALAVVVLALVGKIFSTLLGKFLATPVAVFAGLLILRQYLQSEQDRRKTLPPFPPIDDVEDENELVRDATFLVLQDVAEYSGNHLCEKNRNASFQAKANGIDIMLKKHLADPCTTDFVTGAY